MKFKKYSTKAGLAIIATALIAAAFALGACAPASSNESLAASRAGKAVSTDGGALTVTTPLTATADAVPTMSKHDAHGVTCIMCHDTATPTSAPTSDAACLTCHNSDALVASTAEMEDIANRQVNPHDNHMHGASCLSCHSNHGVSTVACNECHTNEYNWLVP